MSVRDNILEKLQTGRRSSGYDVGRFSPFHEPTTHRFRTLIARALHGPPRGAAQPLLRTSQSQERSGVEPLTGSACSAPTAELRFAAPSPRSG